MREPFKWEKIGRILDVGAIEAIDNDMSSHAMVPLADHIEDNKFRIYFTSRDKFGRGRIYSIIYDIKENKIIEIEKNLVLDIGKRGCFDDNGVVTASMLKIQGKSYFYFSGINVRNTIPFSSNTGLAYLQNGKAKRVFSGPVLDRNHIEPHFSTMPYVLFDKGLFKIWYLSGVQWNDKENDKRHYYHIKYAESEDGIKWKQTGKVSIDFKNEFEYAIARPCVISEEDKYKMWYCYRGQKECNTYRIGYAESENGWDWVRMDDIMTEFKVSDNGWDSEMLCYPFVFDHDGERFMLYNGNGYGKTGFGLAKIIK